MKQSLFALLLFLVTFPAFTQTTIAFGMNGGKVAVESGDLSKATLPIQLSFPKTAFTGKQIELRKTDGSTIAGTNFTFGQGDLTTSAERPYAYIIGTNKKTNPGKILIADEKVNVYVDGKTFGLTFSTNETNNRNNDPQTNGITDISQNYTPGYAFYDAMKIGTLDKIKDRELIELILADYGINNRATLIANPFLKDLLGSNFFDDRSGPQGGIGAAAMLTNLGNTDVTQFASGLARFLAERTKEELNAAFFDKMQRQLEAYPELKTIFPKTASFMALIDNYSYASVIQVLKEAFQTDIQNLPENLYELKSLSSASCNVSDAAKQDACKKRLEALQHFFVSETGLWVSLGMRTLKESTTASNPAELLNAVATSTDLDAIHAWAKRSGKPMDYNGAAAIELANFLSANLLSKEDGKVWVNSYELQKLLSTQKTLKAYLGLLYANTQTENIIFLTDISADLSFRTALDKIYQDYVTYSPMVVALIKNAHNACNIANNAIDNIRSATEKGAEADMQSLYNYYRTFIAMTKPVAQSELLKRMTNLQMSAKFDSIEQYLSPAIDIAYHISVKHYSSAIYDAVLLLNKTGNGQQALSDKATKAFIQYGTLISSVAGAQSSDEVKAALEASMLPSGSSSIKRNSNWSAAVNAYVGGYWGYAHTKSTDSTHARTSYQTYGLYAPIGVSLSKGVRFNGVKCGSLTTVIQVLDLGALVNFYLINGDSTALPNDFKVRLSNIFAPGAQLAYDIPRTPLSVSFGGQFVPALYQTSQITSSEETTAMSAWRWNVSLVVDLPLLGIGARDYKK